VPTSDGVRTPTLLLVEDDIFIRMEMAGGLRSVGFRVVEASNGEEALALLHSSAQVHLVLTDLRMPRMDGAALVERIRAQFPLMPIFMTSAQLPSQTVCNLLDGFFSKPLDVANFASYLVAKNCVFKQGP
jgi:CheY-like chemotaxis protein